MRLPVFSLTALLVASAPALADETSGMILAFDRVAKILVLEDKTVWPLETAPSVPEGLAAGDIVKIIYTSDGDNGLTRIDEIVKG